MNLLVNDLNLILKSRIGDIEFNTNFRYGILFEKLMKDPNIDKEIKVIQAIKIFYPKPKQITDYEKAIKDLFWFYTCGKNELEKPQDDKKLKKKPVVKEESEKKIYDYDIDDGYIYSAFLQQYGIDLQEIDYLHWWKFKAMFNSLNSDTKIVEIMGYRNIDLRKIKDKQEKARYKKLKEIYKLPDMRTEAQKERDLGNAFW